MDKDEYYNSITMDRHILYKQYSSYEQFGVPGEEWQDKEYEPYLDTEFYELYIAGLAHKVVGDIVQESEDPDYWSPNSEIITSRVQYKGLDEAYYIHSDIDNIYTVIARRGSRVIKLSYSGKRPYTDLIEAAQKKLSEKQGMLY